MIPGRDWIATRIEEAAFACRSAGAQLTPLRRDVLALILGMEGPVSAYQLLDRLRETRPGAVPPTVYRALNFLLAHRLIHKVESLNAYVSCTQAVPHAQSAQFLICSKCGTVAEVEDESVSAALRQAAERHGFRATGAVVEVSGLCPACS